MKDNSNPIKNDSQKLEMRKINKKFVKLLLFMKVFTRIIFSDTMRKNLYSAVSR